MRYHELYPEEKLLYSIFGGPGWSTTESDTGWGREAWRHFLSDDDRKVVGNAVNLFSRAFPRHGLFICLRFGFIEKSNYEHISSSYPDNMRTFDQIAERANITRERARQIVVVGLRRFRYSIYADKLRRFLNKMPVNYPDNEDTNWSGV